MGESQEEALVSRIRDYILRAMNDPSVVRKNPGEFQSIIAAWRMLSQLLPGLAAIKVADFQQLLQDLANENVKTVVQKSLANVGPGSPASNVLGPAMPPPPALPTGKRLTTAEMMDYQQKMKKYAMMMQMMSGIMQKMSENQSDILKNIR